MKTPPAHVLARLDDIIVGQEEAKDGGGTPPRHVLLQNCDDDDDAAFGIESSASSFSTRPQGDDRSDDTAAPEPKSKVRRIQIGTTRITIDRPSVVGPDPARAPTETSSKYWGVTWQQSSKRWQAQYTDAENATQYLGVFRTQEAAAHRVNAAIETLPAHVQRRRRKNEVDAATGKLLPLKKSVAPGHGPRHDRYTRARRSRRAVNFDDYLQPDDEDGWD